MSDSRGNREFVKKILEMVGAADLTSSAEGWVGRCPFHEFLHRSKSPSFAISASTGRFICFSGACGKRGGLATMLTQLGGFSFADAKAFLGDQWLGLSETADPDKELVFPTWEDTLAAMKPKAEPPTTEINPSIIGLYRRCPVYMLERGFEKAILKRNDIGFEERCRFDEYQGQPSQRVTIPVWNRRGRLVGITKRAIQGQSPPYIHHKLDKRWYLYGEHFVGHVTGNQPLIVTESQMSQLWMQQAAFDNGVSTMGVLWSEHQRQLIDRYPLRGNGPPTKVLFFDRDGPGQDNTARFLNCDPDYLSEYGVVDWSLFDAKNKDDASKLAKDPQEASIADIRNVRDAVVLAGDWLVSYYAGRS